MAEYEPLKLEKKWQDYWEKHSTFKTGVGDGERYYVLDMFPYPSGSGLHMGHPLGYVGSDIQARYKRHLGWKVLHPMGYDAFGLPTEQHAIATGEHPAIVTNKNCNRFTEQLKELGLSYDWDHEVRTTDPKYFRWTQWIFLKLYNSWFDDEQNKARPIEELPIPDEVSEQGEKVIQEYQAEHRLAYLDEAMVNWCPALGTVLANEEVIDGRSERGDHEVVRRPMKQWLLRITKYSERLLSELEDIDWPENIKEQQRNWIGKRHGADIKFQVAGADAALTAFTTRPDTLFGVTFFVISPEHPLVETLVADEYKDSVSEYCEKAAKLSDLARTMENREKTGAFTGSYVVNPATEEEVPLYVGDYVLMSYGTGAVMGVAAHDERDFEFARTYNIPVRPVIVPKDQDDEVRTAVMRGDIAWTDPGSMLVCEYQIAQDLGLSGKENEEAKKLVTDWLSSTGNGGAVVNYRLKDWLFSRQRYWGEPIPIIHWEDGLITALDEEELPLELPDVEDYLPSEGGESPLAKSGDWLVVTDETTGRRGRRETNTMPQWAGSCWYHLRFIDPHNDDRFCDEQLEKDWMPVDLYVGGAEHAVLHLLYARFWHKVLYDLGYVSTVEPYNRLYNQGMLVSSAYKDARGALIPVDLVEEGEDGVPRLIETGEEVEKVITKMSKSLRNVVNPDEVINEYGADTLRIFQMFLGPLDGMKVWDSQAIAGSHRFLKKVFSAVVNAEIGEEADEVTRARHAVIKKVTEDVEGIRYNTAIAALMEFVNLIGGKVVSKESLEALALLLAPLAPHLAEELWEHLGHSESLSYVDWPKYDEAMLVVSTVSVVIQVTGKKRGLVEVDGEISEDDLKAAVSEALSDTDYAPGEGARFIVVRDKKTSFPKLVNVLPN